MEMSESGLKIAELGNSLLRSSYNRWAIQTRNAIDSSINDVYLRNRINPDGAKKELLEIRDQHLKGSTDSSHRNFYKDYFDEAENRLAISIANNLIVQETEGTRKGVIESLGDTSWLDVAVSSFASDGFQEFGVQSAQKKLEQMTTYASLKNAINDEPIISHDEFTSAIDNLNAQSPIKVVETKLSRCKSMGEIVSFEKSLFGGDTKYLMFSFVLDKENRYHGFVEGNSSIIMTDNKFYYEPIKRMIEEAKDRMEKIEIARLYEDNAALMQASSLVAEPNDSMLERNYTNARIDYGNPQKSYAFHNSFIKNFGSLPNNVFASMDRALRSWDPNEIMKWGPAFNAMFDHSPGLLYRHYKGREDELAKLLCTYGSISNNYEASKRVIENTPLRKSDGVSSANLDPEDLTYATKIVSAVLDDSKRKYGKNKLSKFRYYINVYGKQRYAELVYKYGKEVGAKMLRAELSNLGVSSNFSSNVIGDSLQLMEDPPEHFIAMNPDLFKKMTSSKRNVRKWIKEYGKTEKDSVAKRLGTTIDHLIVDNINVLKNGQTDSDIGLLRSAYSNGLNYFVTQGGTKRYTPSYSLVVEVRNIITGEIYNEIVPDIDFEEIIKTASEGPPISVGKRLYERAKDPGIDFATDPTKGRNVVFGLGDIKIDKEGIVRHIGYETRKKE
jgi:hypothetical protein